MGDEKDLDSIVSRSETNELRRICLFGPESTGKSVLAGRLAAHFGAAAVPEFARRYLVQERGACRLSDILEIAKGQAALEDSLAPDSGLLICDTDPLLTCIWSEMLFGTVEPEVWAFVRSRPRAFYLLLDIDVPWVDDGQRNFADDASRARFFALCRDTLRREGQEFAVISGDYDARFAAAVRAIEQRSRD